MSSAGLRVLGELAVLTVSMTRCEETPGRARLLKKGLVGAPPGIPWCRLTLRRSMSEGRSGRSDCSRFDTTGSSGLQPSAW